MGEVVRLQKYLAECGVASRRKSEKLIEEGRVTVNGAAAAIGATVRYQDDVAVDGIPVTRDDKIYVVLNKPKNVVTTVADTHDRKTVVDCVIGVRDRIFPVGRLDFDVEGVLLMTNDGELAHRLTHPSYKIEKVYLVWVKGDVNGATLRALEKGVKLEDGITAPAKAEKLRSQRRTTLLRLTLREGRKREVKRMCAAVSHPVIRLQRIAMATITADDLMPGEWRYLRDDEVETLKALTGLIPSAGAESRN